MSLRKGDGVVRLLKVGGRGVGTALFACLGAGSGSCR